MGRLAGGVEVLLGWFAPPLGRPFLVPRVRGVSFGWVLADDRLLAAVRWGVFLKEGNFLLGSDVFVTDRQSDAYAVDAIPRGIFDEDYLRWIRVEVSDRSFETSHDRRTLGSPDGGRSRMWRR